MNALLLLSITSVGYLIAYHTYGRFLAKKIFKLNAANAMPSKEKADRKDFVASAKQVLFGHHFTSIAGTGPIVGPAIGVIWGWGPAVLWVFFGSIFMGAVHDFSTLVISMRNEGKSISEISEKYINKRVRRLFFIVVFLALWIVIAIFGLVVAIIFSTFPQSVIPVWLQIPISIGLGSFAFKRSGSMFWGTIVAVGAMALTVAWGAFNPFVMPAIAGIPPTGVWTILLLVYAYIASILPVSTLLQPRDYINAWQLYITLGLIVLGLVVAGFTTSLTIPAPFINSHPVGAPSMWPYLFITIACGAISGFHCLVCSGTSSKQISNEEDAQFIGYGAMVTEAFLATLILLAVTAGLGMLYTTASGEVLTGIDAWNAHYGSWASSSGMGSKLSAVVGGCSNFMSTIGISLHVGTAIIGVFIASFAGTTLDSATRVQRYVIAEMFEGTRYDCLSNKWIATGLAVVTAAILAFSTGADGKGALMLWPMFGAVNQLLGGLALIVASAYLLKHHTKKVALITAIPCAFLMIMTTWASVLNEAIFIASGTTLLILVNGAIMIVSVTILIEAIRYLYKYKRETHV